MRVLHGASATRKTKARRVLSSEALRWLRGWICLGTVPRETKLRDFKIDPSGRCVLAGWQISHRLSSYAIEPRTGVLTRLKEYGVRRSPDWVESVDLR